MKWLYVSYLDGEQTIFRINRIANNNNNNNNNNNKREKDKS